MPFVGVEAYNPKRTLYFLTKQKNLVTGEWCVFKSQDGWEIGKIIFCVEKEFPGEGQKIRKATLTDLEESRKRENIAKKAQELVLKKIVEYGLPMRLTSTRYPLGKKKITFYYTAKERVDFRKLVKDIAKVFKVHIQMQQIGVRDEPQILGGIGICGRQVCCANFLGKNKDRLESVALEAARIQNLPLVSSKISGICGRLRCCLNFEYHIYSELAKQFPEIGREVKIKGERFKVVSLNFLTRTITVEDSEGIRKTITKEMLEKQEK
ncbi:stage 0 sporulation protein [Candidatus Aerophobetes bacterium]|nr:stage 0 sporulation protein [Candidatus Aerophobetes bacterium]